MSKRQGLPVDLTEEQIDEFGREMDAIYYETLESRGEKDRLYILRLIRIQRSMAPENATASILSPADGATVTSPVTVTFGLEGMDLSLIHI